MTRADEALYAAKARGRPDGRKKSGSDTGAIEVRDRNLGADVTATGPVQWAVLVSRSYRQPGATFR
jgi:hypothetical protein